MEKLADLIIRVLTGLLEFVNKKKTLRNVQNIVDIYVSMKKLVFCKLNEISLIPVYQIVIFEVAPDSSKQKRVPSIAATYLLTCLYSDYRPPVESFARYKRINVDGEFMQFILETMKEGKKRIMVKELNENSLLQLILSTEQIKYSEFHYLYQHKDTFYVALISTVQAEEYFTAPLVRMEIKIAIDRISKLISKM